MVLIIVNLTQEMFTITKYVYLSTYVNSVILYHNNIVNMSILLQQSVYYDNYKGGVVHNITMILVFYILEP